MANKTLIKLYESCGVAYLDPKQVESAIRISDEHVFNLLCDLEDVKLEKTLVSKEVTEYLYDHGYINSFQSKFISNLEINLRMRLLHKIVCSKFKHQLFLEPESEELDSLYVYYEDLADIIELSGDAARSIRRAKKENGTLKKQIKKLR